MDKFSFIRKESFSNASGDDNFPLAYGSRGSNTSTLQSNFNRLGVAVPITGVWDDATEAAATRLGYPNYVDQNTFNSIQQSAYPLQGGSQDISQMSTAQLQAMWQSQGSPGDFNSWLQKEKTKLQWQSWTNSLLGLSKNYIGNPQGANTSTVQPGNQTVPNPNTMQHSTGFLGMSNTALAVGGLLVAGLVIYLVSGKKKGAEMQVSGVSK